MAKNTSRWPQPCHSILHVTNKSNDLFTDDWVNKSKYDRSKMTFSYLTAVIILIDRAVLVRYFISDCKFLSNFQFYLLSGFSSSMTTVFETRVEQWKMSILKREGREWDRFYKEVHFLQSGGRLGADSTDCQRWRQSFNQALPRSPPTTAPDLMKHTWWRWLISQFLWDPGSLRGRRQWRCPRWL